MSNRPTMAMRVTDLSTTIRFCVEKLGCTLVDHLPYADTAHMLDVDNDLLLLAGPEAKDVTQQLDAPRFVFNPGDTIKFAENDIEARRKLLQKKGVNDIQIKEEFLGDLALNVVGPDGYIFAFLKRAPHTPEAVLAAYKRAPEELEEALGGLSEASLDLATAPGQWSIRKIVHHLAESESMLMMQIRTALAEPGMTYIRNPYNQATWPETLDYAGRAIEPSVALVKAIHGHIVQLIEHVPAYTERYVMAKASDTTNEGRKIMAGDWLDTIARHIWEHCEEIREIRRIHRI